MLPFVDDLAGGGEGFAWAVYNRNRMLRDSDFYGFTMSAKSVPLPFQRLRFLGYVKNLACPVPSFHIPREKVRALEELAKETAGSLIGSERVQAKMRDGKELRIVVDICSGKCSVGWAHFLLDSEVFVLAFDIMSERQFFDGLPEGLKDRVRYRRLDVIELSLDLIRAILHFEWGAQLIDVIHLHWSPMCETMSRASRGKGAHRWKNWEPRSDKAIAHDLRFHHVLRIIVQVVEAHPFVCISVENPENPVFPYFPDLQELLLKDGWKLVLRADHCVMANEFDSQPFPNKPSSWLLHGVHHAALEGMVCEPTIKGCKFRLHSRSVYHRVVVCRRRFMHPAQKVLRVTGEKSRIPVGAFHRIWRAHKEWVSEVRPGQVPMRRVAKIVGRLVSMGLAIAPSQLMSRDLTTMLYSNEQVDWDAWVREDPAAVDEMLWIAKHLHSWNSVGMPIWKKETMVDVVVTQDSSPAGVGFRLEESGKVVMEGHMPFTCEESQLDHVHREMLGLVYVFLVHGGPLVDRQVQVRVDSKSTVKYVRDRGGGSRVMNYLVKKLWAIAIRLRISIALVSHISGIEMVRIGVDGLSSAVAPPHLSEGDREGWRMAPHVWQWIEWYAPHPFTCDRFASRANTLLPRFCSLSTEPGALLPPNAMAHNWRENEHGELEMNWAFPPLRLVSKVLHLIREQKARACVLVPDWAREWFPSVMAEAQWVWRLTDLQPHFLRRVGEDWQEVQQSMFVPMVVYFDFTKSQ